MPDKLTELKPLEITELDEEIIQTAQRINESMKIALSDFIKELGIIFKDEFKKES